MKFRTLMSIGALGMGLAFVAAPAQAEETSNHCVLDVSVGKLSCFNTFGAAIANATDGRVTEVPNDVRKAVDDPKLAEQLKNMSTQDDRNKYILSIEYEDSDYEDNSLIATGPYQCSASMVDIDYYLPRMPPGWNDQIGSFRTWTDVNPTGWCYVQHFEHDDFQGGWIGYSGSQGDLGGMDDETSSIRWT